MATQQNVKYICDRCGTYVWADFPDVLPKGWARKIINENRYDLCHDCAHEYNMLVSTYLSNVVKNRQ